MLLCNQRDQKKVFFSKVEAGDDDGDDGDSNSDQDNDSDVSTFLLTNDAKIL